MNRYICLMKQVYSNWLYTSAQRGKDGFMCAINQSNQPNQMYTNIFGAHHSPVDLPGDDKVCFFTSWKSYGSLCAPAPHHMIMIVWSKTLLFNSTDDIVASQGYYLSLPIVNNPCGGWVNTSCRYGVMRNAYHSIMTICIIYLVRRSIVFAGHHAEGREVVQFK